MTTEARLRRLEDAVFDLSRIIEIHHPPQPVGPAAEWWRLFGRFEAAIAAERTRELNLEAE